MVYSATRLATPSATSSQKIARHPAQAATCAPTTGPSSGAIAMTTIRVESIRAARAPSYRSRTMAREMTTQADAPSAWAMRQPMMVSALAASAQPAEPMMNSTSPAATGRRRPNLSLTGPQNNWPTLKPIR